MTATTSQVIGEIIQVSKENTAKLAEFAKQREYNMELLLKLGLGYFDAEAYQIVGAKFPDEVKKFRKWIERVIIPYSGDYCAARSLNRRAIQKNLFPVGIDKTPFYIDGDKSRLFIVEGETSAIGLKHIMPEAAILSLGGAQSQKPLGNIEDYLDREGVIILALDNDEAGKNGTIKALKTLAKKTIRVELLKWDPEIKDPDDLWRAYKKDGTKHLTYEKADTSQKGITSMTICHDINDEPGVDGGNRNNKTYSLALKLCTKGTKEDDAIKTLLKWNLKNNPPLNDQEVISTISSAYHNKREPESDTKRQKIEYSQEQKETAELIFKDPRLLLKINDEIGKRHLKDNGVKLTAFIVEATSYLKPASQHKSLTVKGSSAAGKDNLIKSTLEMYPKTDYLFLTNATQSTMEDDIADYKIIAYSEMNLKRDDKGANSHMVEVIKQMAEGGTSSLKKDLKTGFKSTLHVEQEQKTILYGTTETDSDEELSTRFIVCSVEADEDKIRTVHDNTFDWFGGDRHNAEESWVAAGIQGLQHFEVILPFMVLFKGKKYFDATDPRSMRDVKRLLSCASAVTWIYQKQRLLDSQGRIIGTPFDFLAALIVTGPFFNHTYQGLGDQRLQRFIDAMNEYCDAPSKDEKIVTPDTTDIFPRHIIQQKLGVSIGTIRNLSKGCQDLSIIRFHHTENSAVYYQRCQKGVKRVLMGVTWREIIDFVFKKGGVKIPESDVKILEELEKLCNPIYEKDENDKTKVEKGSISGKNDTLLLTPPSPQNPWDAVKSVLPTNGKDEDALFVVERASELSEKTPSEINVAIQMLMRVGDIYEPRKGRLARVI